VYSEEFEGSHKLSFSCKFIALGMPISERISKIGQYLMQ